MVQRDGAGPVDIRCRQRTVGLGRHWGWRNLDPLEASFFFGNQIQAARGGPGGDGRRRLANAENPQLLTVYNPGMVSYSTSRNKTIDKPKRDGVHAAAMIHLENTPYSPSWRQEGGILHGTPRTRTPTGQFLFPPSRGVCAGTVTGHLGRGEGDWVSGAHPSPQQGAPRAAE